MGGGVFVRVVIKVMCVPELEEKGVGWIPSPLWLCYFERLINLSEPHLAHMCHSRSAVAKHS